jgi:hypothetical protein
VYQSAATNLVPADGNGLIDVFETLSPQGPFTRGDTTGNGVIDLLDCQVICNWLGGSASVPPCLDAADANDSGTVNITDCTYLCNRLFSGGPPPPPPTRPNCGLDPTADALTCADPTNNCE